MRASYEDLYMQMKELRYELMDKRKLERKKKATEVLDDCINNLVEVEPLLRELSEKERE